MEISRSPDFPERPLGSTVIHHLPLGKRGAIQTLNMEDKEGELCYMHTPTQIYSSLWRKGWIVTQQTCQVEMDSVRHQSGWVKHRPVYETYVMDTLALV